MWLAVPSSACIFLILAQAVLETFDPTTSDAAFSAIHLSFGKCQPEVAGDVISDTAVEWIGVDVRAKFGDARLNSGRIIRLFPLAGPVLRTYVQC